MKAEVSRGNIFDSHERLRKLEQRLREHPIPHQELVYGKQLLQCSKARQLLCKLNFLIVEDRQREATSTKKRDHEDVNHSEAQRDRRSGVEETPQARNTTDYRDGGVKEK